jgi:hypothetical protein
MTDEDAALLARTQPLLEFLDAFPAGVEPGEWKGGERDAEGVIHMPYFEPNETLNRFTGAVGSNGWLIVADWAPWVEAASAGTQNPSRFETATPEELAQSLTVYIRRNRFYDGTLAGAAQSGALAAIVRRMAALAEEIRKRT